MVKRSIFSTFRVAISSTLTHSPQHCDGFVVMLQLLTMRIPMQIFDKIVRLEELTFKCGMVFADAVRRAERKLAFVASTWKMRRNQEMQVMGIRTNWWHSIYMRASERCVQSIIFPLLNFQRALQIFWYIIGCPISSERRVVGGDSRENIVQHIKISNIDMGIVQNWKVQLFPSPSHVVRRTIEWLTNENLEKLHNCTGKRGHPTEVHDSSWGRRERSSR